MLTCILLCIFMFYMMNYDLFLLISSLVFYFYVFVHMSFCLRHWDGVFGKSEVMPEKIPCYFYLKILLS